MLIRLASAEVSFLVHATEEEERVLKTVSESLSIPREVFQSQRMTGHFGNPITLWMASVKGERASRFAEDLLARLDADGRLYLMNNLTKHVDEHGAIYLRMSKQKLFAGRIELSQLDPVRIRLKPAKPWRKSTASTLETLLHGS